MVVLEIITVFRARLCGARSHKSKKLIEALSDEPSVRGARGHYAWIRYEPGQDTQDSFALDRLNRKMDRLNARMDRSRNEYGKNRSSSRRERPLRPPPQAVRQESFQAVRRPA